MTELAMLAQGAPAGSPESELIRWAMTQGIGAVFGIVALVIVWHGLRQLADRVGDVVGEVRSLRERFTGHEMTVERELRAQTDILRKAAGEK